MQRLRKARETSPRDGSMVQKRRKSACGRTILGSPVRGSGPLSLTSSSPPGSRRELRRSRTEALQRLTLSRTTHSPRATARGSAPSTHSNRPRPLVSRAARRRRTTPSRAAAPRRSLRGRGSVRRGGEPLLAPPRPRPRRGPPTRLVQERGRRLGRCKEPPRRADGVRRGRNCGSPPPWRGPAVSISSETAFVFDGDASVSPSTPRPSIHRACRSPAATARSRRSIAGPSTRGAPGSSRKAPAHAAGPRTRRRRRPHTASAPQVAVRLRLLEASEQLGGVDARRHRDAAANAPRAPRARRRRPTCPTTTGRRASRPCVLRALRDELERPQQRARQGRRPRSRGASAHASPAAPVAHGDVARGTRAQPTCAASGSSLTVGAGGARPKKCAARARTMVRSPSERNRRRTADRRTASVQPRRLIRLSPPVVPQTLGFPRGRCRALFLTEQLAPSERPAD